MRDRSAVDQKPQKAFYSDDSEGSEEVRRKTPATKDRRQGVMPEQFLGFLRFLFFSSHPLL